MATKNRFLGLRLTGDLKDAMERYCDDEQRSLSSGARFLLAAQLRAAGYLPKEPKDRAA